MSPNIPDRQKIIGQEIIKLYTALSLDLVGDIIDAKVTLALQDWNDIPTNWIRRTCARARKQCEWLPKTSELILIFRTLRAKRRIKKDALEKLRRARALEEGPMNDATRMDFMRDYCRRMGVDYDREKRREALKKELEERRAAHRRMEVA